MVNDNNYSIKLRALSKEYYQNRLEIAEYRAKRKIILNKLDKELNGVGKDKTIPQSSEKLKTQKNAFDETSIIMKTIAFFKNKNNHL